MLANWQCEHRCEDTGAAVVAVGGSDVLDRFADKRSSAAFADVDEYDAEERISAPAWSLANAVRWKMAEGILCHLRPGHRRLVEQVAFEGLSPYEIATQTGVPVKAVRCNLKLAIRKLCRLGLTSHVVTDKQVADATAAQVFQDPERRETTNRINRGRDRIKANSALVSGLDAAAKEEAFIVEMEKMDAETRVIVAALIDRSLSVEEATELLNGNRSATVKRLKGITKAVLSHHASAQADRAEVVAR